MEKKTDQCKKPPPKKELSVKESNLLGHNLLSAAIGQNLVGNFF